MSDLLSSPASPVPAEEVHDAPAPVTTPVTISDSSPELLALEAKDAEIAELKKTIEILRATAYETVAFSLNDKDHVLPNTCTMSKVETVAFMRKQWEDVQVMSDLLLQTVFQYALLHGDVVSADFTDSADSVAVNVVKSVKRCRPVAPIDDSDSDVPVVVKRRVPPAIVDPVDRVDIVDCVVKDKKGNKIAKKGDFKSLKEAQEKLKTGAQTVKGWWVEGLFSINDRYAKTEYANPACEICLKAKMDCVILSDGEETPVFTRSCGLCFQRGKGCSCGN